MSAYASMSYSAIELLRSLRHGPLKPLQKYFIILGNAYRRSLHYFGIKGSSRHYIGGFGPFILNGEFAFSDFRGWGAGHNGGFKEFVRVCGGKACVFDIGAHIGLTCLPIASKISPNGKIIAFEPSEANFEHLSDHIAKNNIRNIQVFKSLVGEAPANSVPFFELASASGMNSIVPSEARGDYVRVERNQVSIDSFCKTFKILPDVIKIDVEGAELNVLNGARQVLSSHSPIIFLSVHPRQLQDAGHSAEELLDLLHELGYRAFSADGKEVSQLGFSEYILVPKNASFERTL